MDIRGGGGGGASHTKNPNQIFPIIYMLSSKYLFLSLSLARARFSPIVHLRFKHGTKRLSVYRHDRECFEATTKATSRGNR